MVIGHYEPRARYSFKIPTFRFFRKLQRRDKGWDCDSVPDMTDARTINWSHIPFHPVIHLPAHFEVYDFTQGYDEKRTLSSEYGIGKFNEARKGMYTSDLFEGVRNIHMGVDIAAPVGTEIFSFHEGEVFLFRNNNRPQDYGATLITKHQIEGLDVYALFGHLSLSSIENKSRSSWIRKGDLIAWVGDRHENGGWNPHLHFQLSLKKPEIADMPGAVSQEQIDEALATFIDPRQVLGKVY